MIDCFTNKIAASTSRAEVASDRPPCELPIYERIPSKAHTPANLSAQPPQDVGISKLSTRPRQPASATHHARPSPKSVSVLSTLHEDGRPPAGTTDTYHVSPPSTVMSRNSTQRSPISEMAVADYSFLGDFAMPRSSSPHPMEQVRAELSAQIQPLEGSSGDLLGMSKLPSSAWPSSAHQAVTEIGIWTSIPTARQSLDHTTPVLAGSGQLPSHPNFLTPPATRSNSGDDKLALANAPVLDFVMTQESFTGMTGVDAAYTSSSNFHPDDVNMEEQLWTLLDLPHDPVAPPHTTPVMLLPAPAILPDTTSPSQPPHTTILSCQDYPGCKYSTKKYDSTQLSAVRRATNSLRRHQSRKHERRGGPYFCDDCGQEFTRHDNMAYHRDRGRCLGPAEGTSHSTSRDVRRGRIQRRVRTISELG